MRNVLGILGAAATLSACAHAGGVSALPANVAAPTVRTDAGGFTSLYSFKGQPDGSAPAAGMVALGSTLYGTTQGGGQGGAGAVFTTSTAGKEHVLHSFGSSGPDGVFPVAGLVLLGGVFYGTASNGGDHGFGAVFKITKAGKESLIYSFKGGTDGSQPYAPLVAEGGVLYGTTYVGGNQNCTQGCGTVFSVTPSGTEHLIYSFKGGSDGQGPLANLVVINSVLYGTTGAGGKNGVGTIFKTSKSGSEKVLHSFGSGFDGAEPEAGLLNDGGKLYGTTNGAGKNFNGTVFVATTGGSEHVLYNFKGGSDGANPEANLILLNGALYGTTAGGGTPNLGTVFGVNTSGKEHVLHAFKTQSEGSDPRAPLTVVNGALYGTTSLGGSSQMGTIFKVTP